jgi:hypothetical protein
MLTVILEGYYHWLLDAFVNASFVGDVDTRRSTTGYVFKISGRSVSWQSRMQTLVALSSNEADRWQQVQLRRKLCGSTCYYTSLSPDFQDQLQYIKIIRQRFYLLIILVITVGVSILISVNVLCVMLYLTVMCSLCMYRLLFR